MDNNVDLYIDPVKTKETLKDELKRLQRKRSYFARLIYKNNEYRHNYLYGDFGGIRGKSNRYRKRKLAKKSKKKTAKWHVKKKELNEEIKALQRHISKLQ